jgi:iron-regulated transporter 1
MLPSPTETTPLSLLTPLYNNAYRSAVYLYTSYFFAAWGDRMWEFASVVFLLDLFPNTLLPSSLLGFIETAAAIICSTSIGIFIDRTNRLTVIRTSVVAQNGSICVAGVIFFVALSNSSQWSSIIMWSIFSSLCLCACFAKWASSMNKISIHKDWIVVLANGDFDWQTRLNANMRRIDLICSIVAPLVIGVVATLSTTSFASLVISGWSAASLFIELYLNGWVYSNIPALHLKPVFPFQTSNENETSASSDNQSYVNPNIDRLLLLPSSTSRPTRCLATIQAYINHPVFFASLAYCLLYLSCLSFGGIMVAYLKTKGLNDAWLAGGRAIAACVGVMATLIEPIMVKRVGLLVSGLISIWLQAICLLPLMGAFLLIKQDSLSFMITVFVAICSSRFGLWAFDLVETQLMQEKVLHQDAGKINGAQESLMNVGFLLSFVLTIIFSDPTQFFYPTAISIGAVVLSAIIFTVYYWRHIRSPSTNNSVTIVL